jgi:hypothetical protein
LRFCWKLSEVPDRANAYRWVTDSDVEALR